MVMRDEIIGRVIGFRGKFFRVGGVLRSYSV